MRTHSKVRWPHEMKVVRRMGTCLSAHSLGISGAHMEGYNTCWTGRFGTLCEGHMIHVQAYVLAYNKAIEYI